MSPETRVVCPSNALEARRGNLDVLRPDQPLRRLDDLNQAAGQFEVASFEIVRFEVAKSGVAKSGVTKSGVTKSGVTKFEVRQCVRRKPFEVVEFLVQDDLALRPARRERHDQIMAAAGRPRQHLSPAGKACDLDVQAGFFVDLA